MAIDEEYLRMLVEVKGDAAVADLERKMVELGKELANLKALNEQAAISGELLESELQRIAQEATATTKALGQLKGGGGISGQGIMGISFAVQDFASAGGDLAQGLYRIQNNIPVLLSQLGMEAGLAGVISLVSIGIGLLLPKILEWARDLGILGEAAEKTTDQVELLKERIKELESKKIKVGVDMLELDAARAKLKELQEGEEAWKDAMESRSEAQRKSGEEARKALAEIEGGEAAAFKRLAAPEIEANTKRRIEMIRQEIERLDDLARSAISVEEDPSKYIDAAKKLQKSMGDVRIQEEKNVNQQIGLIRAQALKGDQAAIEQLRGRFEAVGMPRAAAQLGLATIEAEEARKRGEAAQKAAKERAAAHKEDEQREAQEAREREREQEALDRAEDEVFQAQIEDRRRAIRRRDRAARHREQVARKAAAEEKRKAREAAREEKRAPTVAREAEEAALAGAIRAGEFGPAGMEFSEEMAKEAAAKAVKQMNLLGITEQGQAATQATLEAMGEVYRSVVQLMQRSQLHAAQANQFMQGFRDINGGMGVRMPDGMRIGR